MSLDIRPPQFSLDVKNSEAVHPLFADAFEKQLKQGRDIELEKLYEGLDSPVIPLGAIHPDDLEASAADMVPRMIEVASLARLWAGSHRGFYVAACGFAYSSESSQAALVWGTNYTPRPGAPKSCAEKNVIAKSAAAGYDHIEAMTVFGPSEFGDVNHIHTETLHPCDQCRGLIGASASSNGLIKPSTLIITTNDTGAREAYYPDELLAHHREQVDFSIDTKSANRNGLYRSSMN